MELTLLAAAPALKPTTTVTSSQGRLFESRPTKRSIYTWGPTELEAVYTGRPTELEAVYTGWPTR